MTLGWSREDEHAVPPNRCRGCGERFSGVVCDNCGVAPLFKRGPLPDVLPPLAQRVVDDVSDHLGLLTPLGRLLAGERERAQRLSQKEKKEEQS